MFERFSEQGVVWSDGRAEAVDTVIFATGYRPNLDYLAPLGALDADRRPVQRHGVSQTVPGLYFVGLSNQRTYASATLRGVGPDAAVVVRHLTRYITTPAHSGRATLRRLFQGSECCPSRQSPV
jgi:putative flavoprotein involved in K+ transport